MQSLQSLHILKQKISCTHLEALKSSHQMKLSKLHNIICQQLLTVTVYYPIEN